ncbi:Crp/Fnr family transcriptional regulator [Desulfolutivibrio sulfoxidireducens]|uniref:Crp/Fnr family transcriptional regulator n=1 Tax=Desulfolutivibrio sulfoxidireducens TaxID=2773299 RepID=UPI00159E0261|nr:Crp/Fnr family transcriptional regulator [Desulfolutivibrio sulfoxidireducens]QLA18426.1 helix-turn-helix domain-containing protein [Desulfolutivibrio sulfoxidireducens]
MPDPALLLVLKSSPFFQELPAGQLERLARGAVARTYAARARVASESEAVRGFFLVLTGKVKLFKLSEDGKEQTLYVFGPGEPFCLGSLFGEGRFPAHAQTLARSRLVFFSGEVLEDMARRDPSILFHFLRVVSRRLKEAMEMIESLSLRGLPGRIAGFLLHAREEDRDGRRLVALGISQRELAKIVGATPEALSRALGRMGRQGLVRVSGREIEIRDRAGLAAVAASDREGPGR